MHRAWTGFDDAPARANFEYSMGSALNVFDPMEIKSEVRKIHPGL